MLQRLFTTGGRRQPQGSCFYCQNLLAAKVPPPPRLQRLFTQGGRRNPNEAVLGAMILICIDKSLLEALILAPAHNMTKDFSLIHQFST
jgi:hypothetical protein